MQNPNQYLPNNTMKRLAQSSNIQTVRYYSTAVACRLQILAARPANPNRKKLGKQQEKKEKKGPLLFIHPARSVS